MSHKGNDEYLEELARLEEDYDDAFIALGNAKMEVKEAIAWEQKMQHQFDAIAYNLAKLKNKNI